MSKRNESPDTMIRAASFRSKAEAIAYRNDQRPGDRYHERNAKLMQGEDGFWYLIPRSLIG